MANAIRTTGSRKVHWIVRVIIFIACAAGFLFVAAIAILNFGAVQGVEFSPDTFASRAFIYYEIPLIRVRITPVWRDDISGVLQRQIAAKDGPVPAATAAEPRWHLVVMTKGNGYYEDDALIVYRYMDESSDTLAALLFGLADDGAAAERWRKWTNDHNELADILWPAVAEACRAELYLFTPELFDIAEQMTVPAGTAPSSDEFETAISASMARQYTALGDARQEQSKHDESVELYDAALKHDSKFGPALAGRKKSMQEREQAGELE